MKRNGCCLFDRGNTRDGVFISCGVISDTLVYWREKFRIDYKRVRPLAGGALRPFVLLGKMHTVVNRASALGKILGQDIRTRY